MATYAIGDIQGCLDQLQTLLEKINFDPQSDQLWFTGDLVNRGPQSLETLRFIKNLGDRAITVLGNHDLHLLAVSEGHTKYHLTKDTLKSILDAPDRDELLHWLRHRPLLHHDETTGFTLVHAGLPPQWNLAKAQFCAQEVEAALQSEAYPAYLENMYGNEPDTWSDTLTGWDRLRFITNCFSRLRFCDANGKLLLDEKGSPGTQPAGFMPWFDVPDRANTKMKIIFGHWSTLTQCEAEGVFPIDTGCLWGRALTALRIDIPKPQMINVPCKQMMTPGSG
ncbi:MAG: symmetrical bis(5'-nucleosyl)-tetraphosphatase [Gammaproteobacteria bacterium]|nr:symmetrical bis(5'-nucleosyl)-tetraphosphatase [Gammaproteobacteria bacterium]